MSDRVSEGFSIGVLAARAGVTPGVLRTWENRFGFPRGERSASGSIIMTGLDADDVERAVDIAMRDGSVSSSVPTGYDISDTSNRVVRFMVSTAARHHGWAGIRR